MGEKVKSEREREREGERERERERGRERERERGEMSAVFEIEIICKRKVSISKILEDMKCAKIATDSIKIMKDFLKL